ncbi:hypothetical protein [Isoptericola sp. b408]|uniref:hypothetical protein n=1 Tax=Isoptericola sp. b408 TaxID=3064653 RepID=UPI00271221A2|nr:hypothetical protein [Isoptericola sp. b408]MDO8150823.1 hypothetical protein [Isoptericola sp. b408]
MPNDDVPTAARPTRPRRPGDTAPVRPRDVPTALRFRDDRRTAVERRRRRGELVRRRRGRYFPPVADDGGVALRRERTVLQLVGAVASTLRTDFVFSHETAALLHGLSHYRLGEQVHVSQAWKPPARPSSRQLRRHAVDVPPGDRTLVGGRPVTTLERTLVDCARSLPGDRSLVIADSALRAGADRRRVDRVLAEAAGRPGVRRARRIVALADARAESPGESLVRWHLDERGFAPPDLAVPVLTEVGTCWVDLGWPDRQVGIEFDGAVKYSGGTYGDPSRRLVAEKRRHDALVEAGWFILRLVWADLTDPARLVARISRALASAEVRR